MIKGIHHISMKCGNEEEFNRARDFYLNVLGFSAVRKWPEGIMIDSGCGLLEIFSNGDGIKTKGAIRHVAFSTDDVDGIIAKVKAAGYKVFIEPNDIVIHSEPEFHARMAFCYGPLGEEIEFFQERKEIFRGKVAVITGGAHGIGRAIADAFIREGAFVHIIDKQPGGWFVGDVSDKETLERFAETVIAERGHVDYLINNALPMMKGIDDCTWEDFNCSLAVGVAAPFYLTKLLMPYFASGASVINIASSRDRMSQPQTESYTAAKGGIAALTHAMAVSLAGKARVNSISPGWIDTTGGSITGSDALQQPAGRVGKPEDISEMVLFLCSDKAGFITGENICIDGGMTKLMIYHGEHGWEFKA